MRALLAYELVMSSAWLDWSGVERVLMFACGTSETGKRRADAGEV